MSYGVAQILCCCDCGVGWGATALIGPLAWELPYAMGSAPKKGPKKKGGQKKTGHILE